MLRDVFDIWSSLMIGCHTARYKIGECGREGSEINDGKVVIAQSMPSWTAIRYADVCGDFKNYNSEAEQGLVDAAVPKTHEKISANMPKIPRSISGGMY